MIPTASQAATGNCDATDVRIISDNPASDQVTISAVQFVVTAAKYGGDPLAEFTFVRCELRPFDPANAPAWSNEQGVRGPVGIFKADVSFGGAPPIGTAWYLCTSVRTTPSNVTTNHGCQHAFTY